MGRLLVRSGKVLLLTAVIMLAAVQFWRVPTAQAHAGVTSSEPPANAVLDAPPAEIRIWFTEPLVPGFGEIQVLDAQGRAAEIGPAVVDGQDPRVMAAALAPLPNGTYVVAWTNLSAIDGHKVRGSFLFAVGEPIGAVAPDLTASQPLLPSPFDPFVRWLTLWSLLTLAGIIVFEVAVARPALARTGTGVPGTSLAEPLAMGLTVAMGVAVGLFLVASVSHFYLQTSITLDIPAGALPDLAALAAVAATGWGRLWLWRMAGAALLAGLIGARLFLLTRPPGTRGRQVATDLRLSGAMLLVAIAMLLTLSPASHAAATAAIEIAAVANDFVHLLAASAWTGGLVALAVSLFVMARALAGAARRGLLTAIVARFSVLAASSVAVLAVTGLYSSWAQVTVVPALRTPYGTALLVKLGLLAPLLLLAALNLLWVRPRLPTSDRAGIWLRRLVLGEVLLAVLLLAPVGVLTALEPARQVASREGVVRPAGVEVSDTLVDAQVTLAVTPGQAGTNRITVVLLDRQGRPIDNATAVSVRPTYLDADLGAEEVALAGAGEGRYTLDGVPLTIAGPWQVAVAVRRPDGFDLRTAFRFELPAPGVVDSTAIMPSPGVSRVLWGAEMALLGLALIGGAYWQGGRRTRRGVGLAATGAVALCAGIVFAGTALVDAPARPVVLLAEAAAPPATTEIAAPLMAADDPAEIPATNPLPPDAASLAEGQRVFAENCVRCHGLTGRGDGPSSVGLNPPPADLLVHIPIHADADLYRLVRDGKRLTAMPALGRSLTATEIWHLVNYLRVFEVDQRLAEAAFTRGLDFAGDGDDQQALASFDESIRRSPNHAQAYNARGVIQRRLGNYTAAIADHTKAIDLEPAFVEAYLNRGTDQYEAGNPAQAIPDYNRALALDADLAPAYYARGVALHSTGDAAAAIRDFDRAVQLNPQYARAYLDRGLARAGLGDLPAARADLAAYVEQAPDAANRAVVDGLIAQLDSQIAAASPPPAPDTTSLLLPGDLPATFVALDPAELGLAAGQAVTGVGDIATVFAYGDTARFQVVAGITVPLTGTLPAEAARAEQLRQRLLAFLVTGIDRTAMQQLADLAVPASLGADAAGLTALVTAQTQPTRLDALAFRAGTNWVYLFVLYPDGTLPTPTAGDAAAIIARRLDPS